MKRNSHNIQPQTHHNRRAFTLIELLVVVTIILVLLAMLVPSINSALEHGNFVACQSNIHQVGMAAYSYMPDYAGANPDSFTWVSMSAFGLHGWHSANAIKTSTLFSYAPNPDLYLCPTFTQTFQRGGPTFQCGDSLPLTPVFSYSMNSYLGWSGWNGKPGVLKSSSIKKPAQCLLFGEEDGWIQGGTYAAWSINNASLGCGNPCDCVATYHYPPAGDVTMGCSNAIFVDGHCEKVWNYNNTNMLYNSLW